ncbi:MAG: hypothetical protein Q4D47_05880, partial [Erysipelotrichaceae bacterium]|nr:hypothetical protein [Erysipelotrichaceae bacterium]
MKGKKNSVKYKENENIISLFQFVKEIEENKQKKRILKVDKSEFFKYIRDLRNNKYIKINYQDKTEDVKENSTVLLSVKKTSFQSCPSPDKIFKDWLKEEWDNFRTDLSLYAFRISGDKDNEYKYFDNVSAVLPDDGMELFEKDEIRVSKFKKWKVERDLWVEEQRKIE